MRILVTGAAGAIGSHLAERLAEMGHEVIGIDCLTDYYDHRLKEINLKDVEEKGVKVFRLDLAQDNLSEVLEGVEVVYHLAAQPGISSRVSFDNYVRNNIIATERLLKEVRHSQKLKMLVYCSTSSVYGQYAAGDEAMSPAPTSYYGVTKLAGEELVLAYHREYNLPATCLRLFSVYGERERPDKLYSKLIKAIVEGRPFPFFEGSENHLRGFTYVGDTVKGLISILNHLEEVKGEIFNIGSDKSVSTVEGIKIVEEILGQKATLVMLPKRAGDILETRANINKARKVLGYQPATSIRDGLKKQVDWYLNKIHNKISSFSVLVATGLYPPDIGGPATYSKLLEDELPKRGIKTVILPFGPVRKFPKIIRHIIYFFRVLQASRGVDIIYAQDPVSVGLPASLAARLLKKPYVLKVVGDYAWEQGVQRFGVEDLLDDFSVKLQYSWLVRFMKWVELFVARGAHHIIVPSEYLKKILINWGIAEDKIDVIYNAFEKMSLSQESKDNLRKKLDISGTVILSVARLVPWKGFVVLIKIIQDLVKVQPGIKLIIIGDGPEEKNLKSLVSSLGLEENIIFTGRLPHKKVLEYVKAADIFVLNSGYEGLSHQLLETMAIGTPIIASGAGGNPELIEDKVNGLLVAYNDKSVIKDAILLLLSHPKEQSTFVQESKKKVAFFNQDRMLAELVENLEGVNF